MGRPTADAPPAPPRPPALRRLRHARRRGPADAGRQSRSRRDRRHIGPATKLPLPRYVSLKTDRVNLREGPSKDHRTLWVFQRAGLPVEIIAEFETWRRIRDSEGTEGWVLHSLLSAGAPPWC